MPPLGIFERVRGRLGSARCILAELSDQPTRLKIVSAVQAAAVEQICREPLYTKVDAVHRAELVEIASRVAWADGDLEKTLTCLTGQIVVTHSRRPSQDARAMVHYFCADEWEQLDGNISMDCARSHVMKKARSLNITTPNEKTVKLFSSFIVCLGESEEALQRYNLSVKRAMMQVLTREFDDLQRKVKQAVDFTELPSDPNILRTSHPELWASAFGNRSPINCRIQGKLALFDSSYACRGSGTGARLAPTPALGHSSSNGSLESVVGMMMQGFAALSQVRSSREPLLTFSDRRKEAPSCLRALMDKGEEEQQQQQQQQQEDGGRQVRLAICPPPASEPALRTRPEDKAKEKDEPRKPTKRRRGTRRKRRMTQRTANAEEAEKEEEEEEEKERGGEDVGEEEKAEEETQPSAAAKDLSSMMALLDDRDAEKRKKAAEARKCAKLAQNEDAPTKRRLMKKTPAASPPRGSARPARVAASPADKAKVPVRKPTALATTVADTASSQNFVIQMENTRSRWRCRLPNGQSVSYPWGDLEQNPECNVRNIIVSHIPHACGMGMLCDLWARRRRHRPHEAASPDGGQGLLRRSKDALTDLCALREKSRR